MIDFNRHVKVTFSIFKEVAFNKNLKICGTKAFWKFQKKKEENPCFLFCGLISTQKTL